jgi:hypothetical protein
LATLANAELLVPKETSDLVLQDSEENSNPKQPLLKKFEIKVSDFDEKFRTFFVFFQNLTVSSLRDWL